MNLLIKSTFLILSYISIYGTPSFLAAPSTHEAANASLISSRGNCILLFPCSISFLFLLLLFFCKENANERNESLLSNCRVQLFFCKYMKYFSFMQVFGGFIVYSPQTDGAGGWRWVGDFFTKMDEGGEKGEEEERRYSCDSCDSFQGRGI